MRIDFRVIAIGHDFGDGFFNEVLKGENTTKGQFHIVLIFSGKVINVIEQYIQGHPINMPGLEDFNDKGDGVFPIGNQVIMQQ